MSRKGGIFSLVGISSIGNVCDDHEEYSGKEIVLDYFDETATTEAISTDVLKFGIYTNVLSHLEWIKNNSNFIDCKPGKFIAWLVDF